MLWLSISRKQKIQFSVFCILEHNTYLVFELSEIYFVFIQIVQQFFERRNRFNSSEFPIIHICKRNFLLCFFYLDSSFFCHRPDNLAQFLCKIQQNVHHLIKSLVSAELIIYLIRFFLNNIYIRPQCLIFILEDFPSAEKFNILSILQKCNHQCK